MVGIFVIMMLVGVVIGVFSGLLGVGGGTIMVPVFRLAFGMSPLASTATSLFTIIPTSVSGAVSHIRAKTCVPKLGVALGIGGACTSPLGVWLAQISPGWAVMVAAALIIGYSATTMLRKAIALKPSEGAAAKAADGDAGEAGEAASQQATLTAQAATTPINLAKAVAIGMAAGIASGYVGLGGGFLMVPLMVAVLNFPMRLSSGTSLIAVMMLAIPGTITQCLLGNVDYLAGIAVACGSIPGAFMGARLMTRIPERALRFTFAGFLGVAAILLVVKETGVLG